MSDLECPYCEEEIDLNHDDWAYYTEDRWEKCECEHCWKTFMVYTSISFDHEGRKADCLNWQAHEWKPICWIPKAYFVGAVRCEHCDKEENHNPEWRKQALAVYLKEINQ